MATNNSFSKRLNILTIVLGVGLLITLFNFYGLKRLESERLESLKNSVNELMNIRPNTDCQTQDNRPVVWISGQRV